MARLPAVVGGRFLTPKEKPGPRAECVEKEGPRLGVRPVGVPDVPAPGPQDWLRDRGDAPSFDCSSVLTQTAINSHLQKSSPRRPRPWVALEDVNQWCLCQWFHLTLRFRLQSPLHRLACVRSVVRTLCFYLCESDSRTLPALSFLSDSLARVAGRALTQGLLPGLRELPPW